MNVDACFQIGHVSGTHGVRGALHVVLDVDQPENYHHLESVFLELQPGSLVPFFVQSIRPKGEKAIFLLEEVSTLEEARSLVGSILYLPLEFLPERTGDSFYFHEIINFRIEDSNLGLLGRVIGVYQHHSHAIIAMDYRNAEVLIPYSEEIVLGLDRQQQLLKVTLPTGLLDIYLEDNSA